MKTFYCWLLANAIGPLLVVEVIVFANLCAHYAEDNGMPPGKMVAIYSSTHFLISFILSLVVAIWVCRFTWSNIYEVVSRRFLYRNSNINTFSFRLKYSIKKWFASFVFTFILYAIVYLIIYG
jgi:hypothetical protein